MSGEELFDVVDDNDRVTGQRPRSEVHRLGLKHRAASIFVFNGSNQLLLQMRSPTKDEYPSRFTSSASGHLTAGEDYETSARRELYEEVGLNSPLVSLAKFPAGPETANEFTVLYRTVTDQPPVPDPGEVADIEWVSLEELRERITREPELFTPPLRTLAGWYWEHCRSHHLPAFQLVVASRNRKKVREINRLLEPVRCHHPALRVVGVDECPDAPATVDETGHTFAENAALKATQTAQATGHWTLADDSGLMVDALGGAPGVDSAIYAGTHGADDANNERVLRELAGVPGDRRGAKFVCHLCVSDPQGQVRLSVEAECRGRIVDEYRGGEGFGYDPLFLLPEYHKTFGELSLAVKSSLSHRARAFHRLLPGLLRLMTEARGR